MSVKITGEAMIKAWKVFAGPGEDYHQWIKTPFFYRWAAGMADGRKRLALCGGQSSTNDTEPQASQGPWPLWTAALSCYWKLLLEALERGFEVDQGQSWDNFTAQAMASIPEDVHDDRDILSTMDLLALVESTPPERCYPNALLNQFDSELAFGDKKMSIEERARREATLLAIAAVKRSPPTRSRGHHSAPHEATHGLPTALYPHKDFTPDMMLGTLPAVGEEIIPNLPG
jgi:hypothetical protein